jgi:hypothetical protein
LNPQKASVMPSWKRPFRGVDRPPITRRQVIAGKVFEITRTTDDIPSIGLNLRDEVRNGRRLMLLVAVHRDHPIKMVTMGIIKRIDDALAISTVHRMAEQINMPGVFRPGDDSLEHLRCAVGAPIIDEKDLIVILAHLGEHLFHVPSFVENRNGDKQSQRNSC